MNAQRQYKLTHGNNSASEMNDRDGIVSYIAVVEQSSFHLPGLTISISVIHFNSKNAPFRQLYVTAAILVYSTML